MAKQRDARALGYTVEGDDEEGWRYVRPDGSPDDERWDFEAETWEAAESDARLWDDDHGEGLDAIDALAAVRAILANANSNSEPDVMGAALDAIRDLVREA